MHDRIFIFLDKTPERDEQADGHTSRGYYSGLHCEQCGRAVKILATRMRHPNTFVQ